VKPLDKEPLTSARREAAIYRLALASWPRLWLLIADLKGNPMAAVREISPERGIADFPRASSLKWLIVNGRWADLGSGASGDTVIDLVVWLAGGCERSKAVNFLEQALAELDANAA
jgi:hypothetical protein